MRSISLGADSNTDKLGIKQYVDVLSELSLSQMVRTSIRRSMNSPLSLLDHLFMSHPNLCDSVRVASRKNNYELQLFLVFSLAQSRTSFSPLPAGDGILRKL